MRKVRKMRLLKETFRRWKEDDAFSSSVIVSYYTIFSLPGLLVIIVTLAGYFFGEEAVTNQISSQIGTAVGEDTAKSVEEMVAKASRQEGTGIATVISALTLILGATGAFYQLRQIMNKIWGVQPDPKSQLVKVVMDRITSLGLILVIGFLLLVSLVLSAAVTTLSDWVSQRFSEGMVIVFTLLDFAISLGVITLLFAAMFKFLPDIRIRWKHVWPGALLTAVLFVVAKFALAIYFSKTDPGSTYGAAGSIVLLMLWVTYSGLILFFGAEFTKVYVRMKGARVYPGKGAVVAPRVPAESRRHVSGTPERRRQYDHGDIRYRESAPQAPGDRQQKENRPRSQYHEPPS